MAIQVRDGAASTVLSTVDRILAESDFSPELEKIELGDWAAIKVYIDDTEVSSTITPPFMEAFLVLQRQVYQLAALAKSGVADIGQLGEIDRHELQINIIVQGGSSEYLAKLELPLTALLKRMVGKMSGKQAATVIVCLAALAAGTWSFCAWLDQTKNIKIEELKSRDHVEALHALQFSTEEQTKLFEKIIDLLGNQGDVGKRAVDALQQANQALLKAASTNVKTKINNVEISKHEANLLRTQTRKWAATKIIVEPMQVVDINTSDHFNLQVVLMEPETGAQHRITFKDNLFSGADRHKLFDALESRNPLWVELAVKEIEGELRVVQLLRTREPPSDLIGENDP